MAQTQITGKQILDHDLTHDDIADGTIRGATSNSGTAQEIALGTISTPDLRDGAVSSLKIDSTATYSMSKLNLGATSNQLVLGTTNTTTLSFTAPSASRTYTIPDAGNSANFVLDKGDYSISGAWSFSTVLKTADGSLSFPAYSFVSEPGLGWYRSGTNSMNLAANGSAPIGVNGTNGRVQLGYPASFLVAPDLGNIYVQNSCSLVVSKTTNQFVLGTTNTTTITSPAPAASRTYTIPDTGTNSSFIMTDNASTQTINSSISLNGKTVVQLLSSDPGSPAEGQIWYRTDIHQFMGYNGTNKVVIG